MQIESNFYEKLHTENAEYGKCGYHVESLTAASAFKRWLTRINKSQVRFLDIGCGKGQFLLNLTEHLRSRSQVSFARVAGLDLVRAKENVMDRITPKPDFFQQSVEGEKLPFPDGSFDLVTCNHVLEHIFQTEHFLREIRRVTQNNGLAVIGVPNTAAWMNRLMFLFGGQPLGSEVGTESVTYGFWPGFMQDRLKSFSPSGHIRDFTPRSLRDLTSACGFKPAGWWGQQGGLLAAVNPKLVRDLGILLEPANNQKPA